MSPSGRYVFKGTDPNAKTCIMKIRNINVIYFRKCATLALKKVENTHP
jgi:hypothetical protein